MNITDVDDKIIRDARAEGVTIDELTARHTPTFLADMDRLRVDAPDVLPRATEHIPEMVALIQTLIDRGHAYRTDDGSIFFRIPTLAEYGQAGQARPDAAARRRARGGRRVQQGRRARLRALEGPQAGRAGWDTAIGTGRPGWHIECSAMSMKYLGRASTSTPAAST